MFLYNIHMDLRPHYASVVIYKQDLNTKDENLHQIVRLASFNQKTLKSSVFFLSV